MRIHGTWKWKHIGKQKQNKIQCAIDLNFFRCFTSCLLENSRIHADISHTAYILRRIWFLGFNILNQKTFLRSFGKLLLMLHLPAPCVLFLLLFIFREYPIPHECSDPRPGLPTQLGTVQSVFLFSSHDKVARTGWMADKSQIRTIVLGLTPYVVAICTTTQAADNIRLKLHSCTHCCFFAAVKTSMFGSKRAILTWPFGEEAKRKYLRRFANLLVCDLEILEGLERQFNGKHPDFVQGARNYASSSLVAQSANEWLFPNSSRIHAVCLTSCFVRFCCFFVEVAREALMFVTTKLWGGVSFPQNQRPTPVGCGSAGMRMTVKWECTQKSFMWGPTGWLCTVFLTNWEIGHAMTHFEDKLKTCGFGLGRCVTVLKAFSRLPSVKSLFPQHTFTPALRGKTHTCLHCHYFPLYHSKSINKSLWYSFAKAPCAEICGGGPKNMIDCLAHLKTKIKNSFAACLGSPGHVRHSIHVFLIPLIFWRIPSRYSFLGQTKRDEKRLVKFSEHSLQEYSEVCTFGQGRPQ